MARHWLFLLLHVIVTPLLGQSTMVVEFDGRSPSGSIGRYTSILVDTTSILTPEQALWSKEYDASGLEVPNLGITQHTYWLKFQVRNRSSEAKLLLSVPHAEIDEIDAYVFSGGSPFLIGRAGQSQPSVGASQPDPGFVFDLDLPIGHERTVLLRIKGFKQIHVPLFLRAQSAFSQERAARNLFFGAYAGIMLVLALYNLFVYFSTRDRSYFLYVLYILAICAAQLAVSGVGQAYLWHGNIWLSSHLSIVLVLASIVFGMAFAQRFVDMKSITPGLLRGVPVFYTLVALNIIVFLFVDPWIGYQLAQAISGLSAVFLMVVMTTAIKRGSRQAQFFLMAWAPFLIGVVVFVLKDAGTIGYSSFSVYAMPLGSAIEGVLLSFGLADRINVLRREKERSQAEAMAALRENERIIRDQNAILEQRVTERTHELVAANDELKRTQVQLVEAEKMAGLGQLTAGIAHEINNPINFIHSNIPPLRRNLQDIVEVLQDFRAIGQGNGETGLKATREKCERLGLDDAVAEIDGMMDSIDEGARRTAEIVKGLRNFSRLDEDAMKLADVNEGIRSTIALLSPQVRGHVTFKTALAEVPQAECLPGKLNQAVMNLLTNGAQAVKAKHGDGGEGLVSIRSWHEDGRITIAVQDNGVGMTDDVRARIFEPFYTTKGVGEGTGLGLSITYSIVQKHNGTIELETAPGVGSEFRIIIPVRRAEDSIALSA